MRWFCLAAVLGFGCMIGDLARAQEQPPELPGVVVRPGIEAQSAPPTEPAPSPAPQQPTPSNSPFDLPLSYPNLSDLRFDGLDGITRSERSLFETPQLGTIITRQDLQERTAQDMFQALQQEVGVLMQRTARGQASPFIRGLTGQQVLLLIDGIRMNNSTYRSGANQYFNTIDPGMVDRIEVLRGPQSTLYGSDAIGGAINVVTRSANPGNGAYGDVSFTEYFSTADSGSYSRGNVEGWVGPTGVFSGASYLNVRDLDIGGDHGRQPFTNYDQYAGDVKLNYLWGCDTMFTFAVQHFEQNDLPRSDRFPPFVFGPPASTPRPTYFDPQQRDLAYARLQGVDVAPFIDAFMFTASYQRQKESVQEIRAANRVDDGEFDVDTLGLQLVLTTNLDWIGRLTYGTDWYHDDVDATKTRTNPINGVVTPITPQFPDDSFYERVGVYLNYDVEITRRLNMIAGVRYENIDLGSTPIIVVDPPGAAPPVDVPTPISPSYQDWVSQVGLVYELSDWLNLCGSYSEGFRAPNLDDLVATNTLVQQTGQDIPSLNLLPEHAYTYEVGLKANAPRLRGQLAVFWTDLEDNILRAPGSTGGVFQRTNRDCYINGVEWYGEYLLGAGWSVHGNFAYVLGEDLERNEPMSRIPPTQGIAGFRWREAEHRQWFDLYTWMVRRQDRLNFQDLTDARIPVGGTPGFATLNLRIGTKLGTSDRRTLSLTFENILDKYYRVHGSGVDGAGANAILGYTQVF